MGGSAGNFQDLIASMNNLNASFQKVGTASKAAGDKSKQSFSDSARIMKQYGNDVNKVSAIAGYSRRRTSCIKTTPKAMISQICAKLKR